MHRTDLSDFVQRVLILAGVVVLLLLMWEVRQVLLLTFFAILIAVPLSVSSGAVERATGLSRGWALLIVGVALAVLVVALSLLVGSQVRGQFSELLRQLSQAVQSLLERLDLRLPISGEGQSPDDIIMQFAGRALSLGMMIIDGLAAIVLIVVGGFFLAANPEVYRAGLVKLFPPRLHAEAEDAINSSGQGLKLWLLTQATSMMIVGTLVGLGTWLIGLPAPMALGLFAGVSEFVPYIGPIIGAIPAIILAANESGNAIWWTLGLLVVIQQIESNLILPLVGEQMMRIPPALLLFAVIAIGMAFGFLGVLIAAPLTVVVYILVKKLYVRRALGEETTVPGEDSTAV